MMILFFVCIVLICIFEFVNGFHDTANAVATVIYTQTLRPKVAVVYSAVMNFIGILVSTSIGYGVAYKVYHLFPWVSLQSYSSSYGIVMLLVILGVSILRNIGTRRYKIPSSSTHALIASIVGATAAFTSTFHINTTVFSTELLHIIIALFISPVIGAIGGYLLYHLSKWLIHDKSIFHAPHHNHEEKWLSAVLIFTCGFVSFNHGFNDGQKGVGMIMVVLAMTGLVSVSNSFSIPLRVILLIPIVLSIGTMIGRERIVETVGKKIGTHEMTYAQGACAELVAASTIGLASAGGFPVSTTHILSSAVLGTMITKNPKSVNRTTIKHIALAWVATIPVCGLLAFFVTKVVLMIL